MSDIKEKEVNRSRFLNMLYKETDGRENVSVNMFSLGFSLGLDEADVMNIVQYLEGDGLAKSRAFGGFIAGKVAITHKGIRQIEDPRSNKPIENIPQKITYNVTRNYIEKQVTGDYFENITDSTIINKSSVKGAFNTIKDQVSEEAGIALLEVANEVEKSKNAAAGDLFNRFTEELNKSNPDKALLKSFWNGVETLLPAIGSKAGVAGKIIPRLHSN